MSADLTSAVANGLHMNIIDRTESPRTMSWRSHLRRALVLKRVMLLGFAGVALLAVQAAQAQGTNFGTIASGQVIHVLRLGVATGVKTC